MQCGDASNGAVEQRLVDDHVDFALPCGEGDTFESFSSASFCLEFSCGETGKKIRIHVCESPSVETPQCRPYSSPAASRGLQWTIPHRILAHGDGRGFSVMLHSQAVHLAQKNETFNQLIEEMVRSSLAAKFQLCFSEKHAHGGDVNETASERIARLLTEIRSERPLQSTRAKIQLVQKTSRVAVFSLDGSSSPPCSASPVAGGDDRRANFLRTSLPRLKREERVGAVAEADEEAEGDGGERVSPSGGKDVSSSFSSAYYYSSSSTSPSFASAGCSVPTFKPRQRSISESADCSSGKKGILKFSRSLSECGEEVEDETGQNEKKTVRFCEKVQENLYRPGSSILGQRKKNQRKNKARRKRRSSTGSLELGVVEENVIFDPSLVADRAVFGITSEDEDDDDDDGGDGQEDGDDVCDLKVGRGNRRGSDDSGFDTSSL